MIWFLLACRSEDKSPDCQMAAAVEIQGQNIAFSDNACAQLNLTPEIIGTGTLNVRFEQINDSIQPILSTDENGATLDAFVLYGNHTLRGSSPVQLWKQGYQSWWWSGVTNLMPLTFDALGLPEVGGDGNGTSAAEEQGSGVAAATHGRHPDAGAKRPVQRICVRRLDG